MYGLRNSELSTCLFQFSHKTRQTMLLYAYFTPKVDFKRKFNHHQSFLYEWRLTARAIQKFRIGPSIRIESRIGHTIPNRIESRSFAGPYRTHCTTSRRERRVTGHFATLSVRPLDALIGFLLIQLKPTWSFRGVYSSPQLAAPYFSVVCAVRCWYKARVLQTDRLTNRRKCRSIYVLACMLSRVKTLPKLFFGCQIC